MDAGKVLEVDLQAPPPLLKDFVASVAEFLGGELRTAVGFAELEK